MTTFLTLKDLVYKSIGRDSTDTLAATIVPAAINYALVVIALLFKPPELNSENDVVVPGGSNKVSISSLNFIDITRVYNKTDSRELFFIPFESWDQVVPPDLSMVKFYSIYGNSIYVKGTPSVNKTLTVYSISYPAELTSDSQSPEFDHYDSLILSIASSICFAAVEEGESVDVWQKVVEALGMPYLKGSQMREVIAGKEAQLETIIKEVGRQ